MATATDFLSTYLEPLAEELTPGQARKILQIKPTEKLVGRVHELAAKASSGEITEQERIEYEYYIDVDDIIGLLKAKARSLLADSAT
jgi:hypothetical protein